MSIKKHTITEWPTENQTFLSLVYNKERDYDLHEM